MLDEKSTAKKKRKCEISKLRGILASASLEFHDRKPLTANPFERRAEPYRHGETELTAEETIYRVVKILVSYYVKIQKNVIFKYTVSAVFGGGWWGWEAKSKQKSNKTHAASIAVIILLICFVVGGDAKPRTSYFRNLKFLD